MEWQREINRVATDRWQVLGRDRQASVSVEEQSPVAKAFHRNQLPEAQVHLKDLECEILPKLDTTLESYMLLHKQHTPTALHEEVAG